MKRGVFIFLFYLSSIILQAQSKWDGEAGDGLWGSPLNWAGNTVPGALDEVILDNSIVPVAYQVSIGPGNVSISVRSLVISPGASESIILLNPVTNVSPVAFMATGTGDAVILNSGAVFRNSSGASSGTPVSVGPDGFFRINNGGRYIHNTERGHTNGLVTRLSAAAGTEDGIFEFDVPSTGSYTISASGRTYGHLVFSAVAAGGSKTYTAAGTSPFTINGNLEIHSHATLSYGANTNIISISKNCLVYAGAGFNIANGGTNSTVLLKGDLSNEGLITESGSSTGSKIEFDGMVTQRVSSTGTLAQTITVSVNSNGGLLLLSPFLLPYRLALVNGKIRTSATNMLIMPDNAAYTGGSASSFVEGPMEKIGDDDFVFPLGAGSMYTPVGISGGSGAGSTDEFMAEYIRGNPQSVHGSSTDPFFDHISYVEYWRLSRKAGSASKAVTLAVHPYSFVKNFTTVYASLYDAGQWINLGRNAALPGPVFPPYETGNFNSGVTDVFGDFTLATTDNVTLNPLPVGLLSFEATNGADQAVELRWQLSAEDPAAAGFEIQRAGVEKSFITIAALAAKENVPVYTYRDPAPVTGRRYYRLKMIDVDKTEHFSAIVAIDADTKQELSLIGSSSPVAGQFIFKILSAVHQQLDLLIVDMSGRIIRQYRLAVTRGQHEFRLAAQELPAGIYLVLGIAGTKRTNVVKCLKR